MNFSVLCLQAGVLIKEGVKYVIMETSANEKNPLLYDANKYIIL